jgi:hypothetical protein
MNSFNLEDLILIHGPVLDVENWEYGTVITFADGSVEYLMREEDCDEKI